MQRLLLLRPAQSSGNNIMYDWRQNKTIHTNSVNCNIVGFNLQAAACNDAQLLNTERANFSGLSIDY
jgi:hypothetical protein